MTDKLVIDDLTVVFGSGRRSKTVLNQVSLSIAAGQTLGLVGESGSGKSTIAKAVVGIVPTRTGRISLQGRELTGLSPGICVRCGGASNWCPRIRTRP